MGDSTRYRAFNRFIGKIKKYQKMNQIITQNKTLKLYINFFCSNLAFQVLYVLKNTKAIN